MTWNDPERGRSRFRRLRLPALLRRHPGWTLAAAAALLLAAWAVSGLYEVGAGDTAWVVRLGVPAGPVGPGLHWRLPWPLARVERVPVGRLRVIRIGFDGAAAGRAFPGARLLTHDQQVFDVAYTVDYTIVDAGRWLFQVRTPQAWVQSAAESAMRTAVAGLPASALLDGRTVAQRATAAAQALLDQARVGVRVQAIHVTAVRPLASVAASWANAGAAAQDRQRLPDAARAAAVQALEQARAAAAQQAAAAQRQAAQTVSRAQADAAAFGAALAAWRQNPSFGHDQLYLNVLHDVLAHSRHVIVDLAAQHGPLVVRVGAATPAPAAASPPAPADRAPPSRPQTGSDDDWRSRNSMRNRDREYR